MQLIAVLPNKKKMECLDFVIARSDNSSVTVTLREKADWPVILGQPLPLVEKWLKKTYLNDLNYALFGALS